MGGWGTPGDRLPGFMVIPKLIKRKVTAQLPVALFRHLIKVVKLEVCATSVGKGRFSVRFAFINRDTEGVHRDWTSSPASSIIITRALFLLFLDEYSQGMQSRNLCTPRIQRDLLEF